MDDKIQIERLTVSKNYEFKFIFLEINGWLEAANFNSSAWN